MCSLNNVPMITQQIQPSQHCQLQKKSLFVKTPKNGTFLTFSCGRVEPSTRTSRRIYKMALLTETTGIPRLVKKICTYWKNTAKMPCPRQLYPKERRFCSRIRTIKSTGRIRSVTNAESKVTLPNIAGAKRRIRPSPTTTTTRSLSPATPKTSAN